MSNFIYTENLDQFKRLVGTRKENPTSVRRLTQSMLTHGFLKNPIMVNEKMEVIDGNQRLVAARRSKVGVYYKVCKGFGFEEHAKMNAKVLNWKLEDFETSFSNRNFEHYLTLKEFRKEYSDFSLTNCLSLLSYTVGFNQSDSFRSGTWKVHDLLKAEVFAEALRRLQENIGSIYKKERFVTAYISARKNPKFDCKRFEKNLKLKSKYELFDESASLTTKQYLQVIEIVHNHKLSPSERCSLVR